MKVFEKYKFYLIKLGSKLDSQDNRMTSHPGFQVKEELSTTICSECGVYNQDRVVAQFFTCEAAEEYIIENKHNLRNPYVYVNSNYKNNEWILIRSFLLELDLEAKKNEIRNSED